MNKAQRAFIIMGLMLIVVSLIGSIEHAAGMATVLYLAVAFLLIAFSIRLIGYMIKQDKLRKNKGHI